MTPSTTSERAPIKQLSSIMVGSPAAAPVRHRCRRRRTGGRFCRSARRNPRSPRYQPSNLRQRRRRCSHRTASEPCCERYTPLTNGRRRNDAETFFLETRFITIRELHWDFIEVAAFRTIDNLVIVNTEREQNRFLQPLMGDPLAVNFFSATRSAPESNREITWLTASRVTVSTFAGVMSARRSKADSITFCNCCIVYSFHLLKKIRYPLSFGLRASVNRCCTSCCSSLLRARRSAVAIINKSSTAHQLS